MGLPGGTQYSGQGNWVYTVVVAYFEHEISEAHVVIEGVGTGVIVGIASVLYRSKTSTY